MTTPAHGLRSVCGYVGPPELRAAARSGTEGRSIRSAADVGTWVTDRGPAAGAEPFTRVVGLDGPLRLAPRRGEHVACAGGRNVLGAGGRNVLGAGGIAFDRVAGTWTVT
ncbi:hypothetical protein [Streptomyces pactum]|uniref:Uncharacterized protein n=1 Tax=Streptomyces pactum TaxID=68249 RepID=A0A1S6JGT9_9ACTN|nr:hypothetical protein [Streptomyces pactum]AQS70970.1 hypothetical protein B1H29_32425 [Streptomyces pactum]